MLSFYLKLFTNVGQEKNANAPQISLHNTRTPNATASNANKKSEQVKTTLVISGGIGVTL